ncbi:hypothetical protein Pyn_28582 [Prunus yedoensis var. nudiflora]|uniref:Uncharacterized protein n=1 Tax=Prunus yedoensis var. nudiflora TaxID=2094558 RepID=A0A314ZJ45_PRUYE|nr:hypothetical protein Pyn_28582 [Prunus yedoensis var. nudiflora]
MADEQTLEFQLFLSMKRYYEFQPVVENDRDNAEGDEKRSNASHIVQYIDSVKTDLWNELRPKLIVLMERNKISQSLSEPRSEEDFDVLEFLMRYPNQPRSPRRPLASPVPPTWTEWFKKNGASWISARGSAGGKFATAMLQLLASVLFAKLISGAWNWSLVKDQETADKDAAHTEPEDTELKDKGKGKGKENEDLDLVGQIAKVALRQFLKESFDGASTR